MPFKYYVTMHSAIRKISCGVRLDNNCILSSFFYYQKYLIALWSLCSMTFLYKWIMLLLHKIYVGMWKWECKLSKANTAISSHVTIANPLFVLHVTSNNECSTVNNCRDENINYVRRKWTNMWQWALTVDKHN